MCPLLAQLVIGFFSFFFLLRLLTVLMKQTRQSVHAIKQSIFLDIYAFNTPPFPSKIILMGHLCPGLLVQQQLIRNVNEVYEVAYYHQLARHVLHLSECKQLGVDCIGGFLSLSTRNKLKLLCRSFYVSRPQISRTEEEAKVIKNKG